MRRRRRAPGGAGCRGTSSRRVFSVDDAGIAGRICFLLPCWLDLVATRIDCASLSSTQLPSTTDDVMPNPNAAYSGPRFLPFLFQQKIYVFHQLHLTKHTTPCTDRTLYLRTFTHPNIQSRNTPSTQTISYNSVIHDVRRVSRRGQRSPPTVQDCDHHIRHLEYTALPDYSRSKRYKVY